MSGFDLAPSIAKFFHSYADNVLPEPFFECHRANVFLSSSLCSVLLRKVEDENKAHALAIRGVCVNPESCREKAKTVIVVRVGGSKADVMVVVANVMAFTEGVRTSSSCDWKKLLKCVAQVLSFRCSTRSCISQFRNVTARNCHEGVDPPMMAAASSRRPLIRWLSSVLTIVLAVLAGVRSSERASKGS